MNDAYMMPQADPTCAILRAVRGGVSGDVEAARLLATSLPPETPAIVACEIGLMNCATRQQTCIMVVPLP